MYKLTVINQFGNVSVLKGENLERFGAKNCIITNTDSNNLRKVFTGYFDKIVIDAPCSGQGMFRKDDVAIKEWSVDNVHFCAERQQQILKDIFPALKEEGILVYSTCTYNEEEDEKNVKWIVDELGADILSVPHKEEWGITESDYGYHFYPHKTKGEGFFLAVLRKVTSDSVRCNFKKVKNKLAIDKNSIKTLSNLVTSSVEFVQYGSSYYAIHNQQTSLP